MRIDRSEKGTKLVPSTDRSVGAPRSAGPAGCGSSPAGAKIARPTRLGRNFRRTLIKKTAYANYFGAAYDRGPPWFERAALACGEHHQEETNER